jgi:acetolactate synthase-1/2/3 large subunit
MTRSDNRLTTAHILLEGLQELGLDYLFCNLGTDHAPLIEEMARWKRLGLRHPQVVLCPHENTAVHMAAGYALATGRGQAVLVHVDAGTANSAMALHNLHRGRVPVLLMAGRAPYSLRGELPGSRDSFVNFVQEPFDQASLVRPYVKWEYTLPSGVIAKEVLRRADSVMHSDPRGPVYLTFARETLTEHWGPEQISTFPRERYGAVAARGTDSETISAIVDRLLAAERPLVITSYAGRNPAAVAALDALARFAGLRVIEANPVHLNIPHDSPCFGGFAAGEHLREADVGLMVDVDVPWIPKDAQEAPQSWWAHIDVDVVKSGFPLWGFPSHLRVPGDSSRILAQLLDALRQRATPYFTARAASRLAELERQRFARIEQAQRLAADPGQRRAINPHHLCAALNAAIAADDVVLNEAIRNGGVVSQQIPRTAPLSFVGLAGAGLGFSSGMALGFKLAAPQRTVIQIVGDGTFYFGNPQSTYAVSKQYRLPIMTVILDNSGWAAVKEATLRVYPDGDARASQEFQAALASGMDFAKVAEAAGGHGVCVEDPDDIAGAITACLQAVRSGRPALLHARVAPM